MYSAFTCAGVDIETVILAAPARALPHDKGPGIDQGPLPASELPQRDFSAQNVHPGFQISVASTTSPYIATSEAARPPLVRLQPLA